MTLVRVIKDWKWPNLMRQTPRGQGVWNDIHFTEEPIKVCDYVVILNRIPQATKVYCSPGSVWGIIQEPPVPEYRWLGKGFNDFDQVFTPDMTFEGPRFHYSHGALPWHVNRDYDFLKTCPPPQKDRLLSWITSGATGRAGHRQRMEFLEKLQQQVQFDLWGRGFHPIEDKWDGLAPYRYALAIENHSGPYYWTEKLADSFLSWTLPIYYGCTNLSEYFPAESFIQIDIEQPEEAIRIIKDTIQGDLYLRRRDAIAEARRLILDQHQFFPFFAALVQEADTTKLVDNAQSIHLPALPFLYPHAKTKNKPQGILKKFHALKQRIKGFLK